MEDSHEWHCRKRGWRGRSHGTQGTDTRFLSCVEFLLCVVRLVSCFWPSLADVFYALPGLGCESKPGRA